MASDQSLQTQKWVLKVPVDCEGCRKKVTKIVHTINGVESCEVDIKHQRVVVTGNVDVGTLLKTLVKKTGKHAELWSEEKKKTKEKKVRYKQRAEEQQHSEETTDTNNGIAQSAGEEVEKEDGVPEETIESPEGSEPLPSAEKKVEKEGNKNKNKGQNGKENIHIRVETPPVDDHPPPINNVPPRQHMSSKGNVQRCSSPPYNNVPPRHHNSSRSAKVIGQPCPPPPMNNVSPRQQSTATSAKVNGQPSSPPRHPIPTTLPPANETAAAASARYGPSYNYPHPQPQPIYTVSYSAAPQSQTSRAEVHHPQYFNPPRHPAPRPSYYSPQSQQPVYTMSYNVAPRPQTSDYGYQGSGGYIPRPYRPYDDEVYYDAYGYRQQQQQQQPESFGYFSDENPNACLIM